MNRTLTTILLVALTACADLDPPTLIKRDRVLGAKVTVDADPTRAWPAAGEQATITWVTASPGATPTFSWTLTACPAASSTGLPACAGPLFALSTATGTVPTLSLAIPADMTAPAIVVAGAICASGTPVIDAASGMADCDDGSRAELVSQHIFLASDTTSNHNPVLAQAPFHLSDAEWAPADGDCDALPRVKPSARVVLGVTFDASDRETFVADGAPGREELQLAAFATAGEVIQQHNYVDSDDDRPTSMVAIEWDPPSSDDVPSGGLRVKFHFVVRDMRGGVDAATREFCVR